jgi:cbb3-type cytochrome oxidase maturation protein
VDEATLAQTIMSALMLAIFLGFFIWGWRSGQFKDIEEAKFNMMSDKKPGGQPVEGKEARKT